MTTEKPMLRPPSSSFKGAGSSSAPGLKSPSPTIRKPGKNFGAFVMKAGAGTEEPGRHGLERIYPELLEIDSFIVILEVELC